MTAKEVTIAGRAIWALRMSYAGEPGLEIHGPRENVPVVYDALCESGRTQGVADYGSFAMNAMRMVKLFKGAGELTTDVTWPEADVMRFVNLDKSDFVGKVNTEVSSNGDLPWLRAYLAIEPDGIDSGHSGEAELMNGSVVGSTASVAYGRTVGKILALACVKPDATKPGTKLQVAIAGESRNAVVFGKPAYDPESLLPRGDAA